MFVSGTTFDLLHTGQAIDGMLLGPQPVAAAPAGQEGKRKLSVAVKPTSSNSADRSSPLGSSKTGGSKAGPTLFDLIDAGLLQPGQDNMRVTYKGTTYAGALQSNGTILFRGTLFNTPSAFSVHVKRLITPGKQGDDGWHSVYVDGVLLNALRQQYNTQMLGQPYTQANKTPRRSHSSPRGQQQQYNQQQQQQQQQQYNQQPAQQPNGQQQQQQAQQQQQQQQPGQRPPLPMPKLKLGNIKGLPQQQHHQQPQQQQQQPGGVLQQPAQPQVQSQPKAQAPKLKFKMSLKLGKGNAAGQKQQQQLGGPQAPANAFDPHQPVLQGLGGHQEQQPAELGPPNWVRCCRCEQWRRVPEGCWPQVAAVGSSWFCDDAGWDVKQQQPFTGACVPDVWEEAPDDDGLMVPAGL